MNQRTIFTLIGLAIANGLASWWVGQQAYHWMPPQATEEAHLVDNLFSFMTTLGSFVFFGVSGTLLYSLWNHRASKYDMRDGPPIEGNVKLEVVWTAIPILLVIWIAGYSYQTYDRMAILGPMAHHGMGMATAEAALLSDETPGAPIEVIARQWSWEFRYPNGVVSTELHLPMNQRAKFRLISDDVLHGFFVPAFRVKQDVVPGRAIDFEVTPIRPGRYRLRDSEYSGTYFAANQTNVVVEPEADYQAWLTTVAALPQHPAPNLAYEEFTQEAKNPITMGWKTVIPAAPPLVNYASSENDSYE